MSKHKFVHVELSSKDAQAMKAFYGAAFDWSFEDFPDMNYTTFTTGENEMGGGFNPVGDENPPGNIVIYLHTDDLADTKAKITAAGGTILMEDYDIPTVGTMSMFRDPSENVIALLQPAEM